MDMTSQNTPLMQGDYSLGSVEKIITNPDQLRLQIVGPNAEVLHFEGPPVGKKWTVKVNVFVKETDA